jgi:hypothetical protein
MPIEADLGSLYNVGFFFWFYKNNCVKLLYEILAKVKKKKRKQRWEIKDN